MAQNAQPNSPASPKVSSPGGSFFNLQNAGSALLHGAEVFGALAMQRPELLARTRSNSENDSTTSGRSSIDSRRSLDVSGRKTHIVASK